MILCLERLPKVRLDYVITYVSEAILYSKIDNGRLVYFFGLRDLPGYLGLGPGKPDIDRFMVDGLLGDVFPIYREWEPLRFRVRGWQAETQGQERHDAALEADLANRAQSAAKNFHFGPASGFDKKEFVVFADLCRQRHCRLVVCCGQLNPLLERALDPALRPDMMAFLHDLAAKDPNVILLEPSQFPPQMESDYEDLTHVTKAAPRALFGTHRGGIGQVGTRKDFLTRRAWLELEAAIIDHQRQTAAALFLGPVDPAVAPAQER